MSHVLLRGTVFLNFFLRLGLPDTVPAIAGLAARQPMLRPDQLLFFSSGNVEPFACGPRPSSQAPRQSCSKACSGRYRGRRTRGRSRHRRPEPRQRYRLRRCSRHPRPGPWLPVRWLGAQERPCRERPGRRSRRSSPADCRGQPASESRQRRRVVNTQTTGPQQLEQARFTQSAGCFFLSGGIGASTAGGTHNHEINFWPCHRIRTKR